jgi:hypothetical protein
VNKPQPLDYATPPPKDRRSALSRAVEITAAILASIAWWLAVIWGIDAFVLRTRFLFIATATCFGVAVLLLVIRWQYQKHNRK